MPSRRYLNHQSIAGTRVDHYGPHGRGRGNGGYGPVYRAPLTGDVALALGCAPRSEDKVYLTVREIVSYGIVEREPGKPKVTDDDVVRAINDLRLEHHAVRDGQLVYDPVPIREALSPSPEPVSDTVRYSDRHLYVHVASVLRGRIKPGLTDRLPTENALRAEFGVSSHTIRNALKILRDEGLIVTIPHKGTFVVPGKAAK